MLYWSSHFLPETMANAKDTETAKLEHGTVWVWLAMRGVPGCRNTVAEHGNDTLIMRAWEGAAVSYGSGTGMGVGPRC